ERGEGGKEPGSVVDDTVPSYEATGDEGDYREELRETVSQLAGERVEGEGEGEPPESAVNTAEVETGEESAVGTVPEAEEVKQAPTPNPVIDTLPVPAAAA
ncbi:unnamed protein product, partial [Pylaiella littoralis]